MGEGHLQLDHLLVIVGQLALALLQARVEVLDGLCVVLVLDAERPVESRHLNLAIHSRLHQETVKRPTQQKRQNSKVYNLANTTKLHNDKLNLKSGIYE